MLVSIFMDGRWTESEVRQMIRRLVDDRGTQSAVAEYFGVSMVYISDVLRKKRAPGDALLKKLGLKRVAYYEAR